jgi:hypothetical protein
MGRNSVDATKACRMRFVRATLDARVPTRLPPLRFALPCCAVLCCTGFFVDFDSVDLDGAAAELAGFVGLVVEPVSDWHGMGAPRSVTPSTAVKKTGTRRANRKP